MGAALNEGNNRVGYWADRVVRRWHETVEGILDTGRTLIDARSEMQKSGLPFSDLIGDCDGKPSQLEFKFTVSYRLIAIAGDERVLSHCAVLPPSWETLYALTRLSDERFQELLGTGVIHPGMQRKDLKAAEKAEKIDRRTVRERELGAKLQALQIKKYGAVLEDFEWDQEVWSRETGMDRHAANHYAVSENAHTPEEIVERTKDRAACAADDCAWFMWTTVPHLANAIDVMRLRGFKYVSSWAWDKINVGTGYWNRNRHEILLLGIKGKVPCPAPGQQWESLLSVPSTEHSAKPEQFLEMIEQYFPTLPKIELNRRGPPRPGWDAWGNEAEKKGEPSSQEGEPSSQARRMGGGLRNASDDP
jgi:N6-adenosine-specific RNA methylase IME4